MKKIILISSCLVFSVHAASNFELGLAQKALSGDYQSQRNLAFIYGQEKGQGNPGDKDYVPQDDIRACAWRKVILMSNAKIADSTDYANESIDCKKVSPTDNPQVWNVVWKALNALPQ
ncbi:hypothetical protein [Martelella alba]|uniref:Uncharacterized protein n=1 Tax=Martelella alba TaxID=2590451 RepID=A0ABY2SU32_9HYPH|nr:hypothetical protein [Martelella alba]TKI08646.1 hypothetical protein FCN80_00915 [Martelella alba]